jgi:catechol 2,3-dioxygenase-like lactoylglutathione lyase family enzyme
VVSDIDRSIAWYQRVLGLERVHRESWGDYPAMLVKGGSGVALFADNETPIQPYAFDSLPHLGFRTSGQHYKEVRSELRAAGIDFRESDPGLRRVP